MLSDWNVLSTDGGSALLVRVTLLSDVPSCAGFTHSTLVTGKEPLGEDVGRAWKDDQLSEPAVLLFLLLSPKSASYRVSIFLLIWKRF